MPLCASGGLSAGRTTRHMRWSRIIVIHLTTILALSACQMVESYARKAERENRNGEGAAEGEKSDSSRMSLMSCRASGPRHPYESSTKGTNMVL